MAAGFDISRAGCGIAEVDSARVAAHDRTRLVDMRQAESMAQLVRGDVKQHLANVGPPTWFWRAEIDFDRKRILPRSSASRSVAPIS
jgi:hypothetical protein